MWKCYAHASRPVVTDVVSAVERLRSVFLDLEFEYAHEIVYGFERYGTDEKLKKEEQLYRNAVALCDNFLHANLCGSCLVSKLEAVNLQKHTVEIKKFLKLENGGSENKV